MMKTKYLEIIIGDDMASEDCFEMAEDELFALEAELEKAKELLSMAVCKGGFVSDDWIFKAKKLLEGE